MRLDLTHDEVAMLERVLGSFLSDLRMEIVRTDRVQFRNELKHEAVLIRGFIARLETMREAVP